MIIILFVRKGDHFHINITHSFVGFPTIPTSPLIHLFWVIYHRGTWYSVSLFGSPISLFILWTVNANLNLLNVIFGRNRLLALCQITFAPLFFTRFNFRFIFLKGIHRLYDLH